MVTLRRLFHLAPAVLAGSALLTIAAPAGGQTPGSAPAQTSPAAAGQGRGAAPAQAAPAAARGPAPTLTSPATPTKVPGADGFIQRWLLLEPIPFNDLTEGAVRAGVKKEYFPNQFTVLPKDGDKVTVDGKELTWHAVDTKLYNVNLYHFAWALNKPTSNVLFWVVTIVNCPQETRDVRLAIGSNAASVWWVNGQEVTSLFNDRQTVIDDGVSKRLTLKKGANIVRAAVINGGGATDFCARFLDVDDKPLKGFTVSLVDAAR
jgi:hypothetical protein